MAEQEKKNKYDLTEILNSTDYSIVSKEGRSSKGSEDTLKEMTAKMPEAFKEIREEIKIFRSIIEKSTETSNVNMDRTNEYDDEIISICREELNNSELDVEQKVCLIKEMSEAVKRRREREKQTEEYKLEMVRSFKEVIMTSITQVGNIYTGKDRYKLL